MRTRRPVFILSVALFAFALATGVALGFGTFATPGDEYELPGSGYDARIADLDRDGDNDLAVPDYDNAQVAVFRGDGSGTLDTPPDLFATGEGPAGIATARLNPGKRPDLVTAGYGSESVSVLLGESGGGYSDPDTYSAGNSPYGIEVADFNRDGDKDVIVANDSDSFAAIYRGRGDGTLRHAREFDFGGNVSGVPEVVVGRFDGDRRPDFAVTLRSDGKDLGLGLSKGPGEFRLRKVELEGVSGPDGLATGDFNRDGDADIALGNLSTLYVLRGRGDGRFRDPQTKTVGVDLYEILARNFDNDNKLDLAISDFDTSGDEGTLLVLHGKRNGRFRDPDDYPGPNGFEGLTAGRLNSDNGLDLALIGDNDPVNSLVYLNEP